MNRATLVASSFLALATTVTPRLSGQERLASANTGASLTRVNAETLFEEGVRLSEQHQLEEAPRLIDAPIPSVYVPSSAERPDGQRRMPRTEELPAVARRSLSEQEKQPEEPRNARALFKRLASNVGLNLKPADQARPAQAAEPSADDAAARSAIEAGASRNPRVSGAPEGARGSLDPHGRQQPQAQQKEHIEIPAFLRKHG